MGGKDADLRSLILGLMSGGAGLCLISGLISGLMSTEGLMSRGKEGLTSCNGDLAGGKQGAAAAGGGGGGGGRLPGEGPFLQKKKTH